MVGKGGRDPPYLSPNGGEYRGPEPGKITGTPRPIRVSALPAKTVVPSARVTVLVPEKITGIGLKSFPAGGWNKLKEGKGFALGKG